MPDLRKLREKHTVRSLGDLLARRPRAVAFYGGSFNPIHIGHIAVVLAALDEQVDHVVICPHAHNPDKQDVSRPPMDMIIDMIALGIQMADEPDRILIAGPAFLDGIQNERFVELAGRLAKEQVKAFVLMGADALKSRYPEFMRSLPHLIAPRVGYPVSDVEILIGECHILKKVNEYSTTLLRQNLKEYIVAGEYTTAELIAKYQDELYELILIGEIYLELEKEDEAEQAFVQVLTSWQGSNSIIELSERVLKAIKTGASVAIPELVRFALYHMFRLCLKRGERRLAEEYLLNAAYESENIGILLVAGSYYLSKFDAEVGTALGYFERACLIDPASVDECDRRFKAFLHDRGETYIHSFLEPYLQSWDRVVARARSTRR